MKREKEIMRVYEDVAKYLNEKLKNGADNFEDIREYHLFCRIKQMYNELYQVKLSYERVLKEDFKDILLRKTSQARQTLYNTRNMNPRKQDLLDGINCAIDDLNEILTLEKVGE